MAAIPQPRPANDGLPRWAGVVGLVLGSSLGSAACYALAALL